MTQAQKQTIPVKRFPEFSDEWNKKPIRNWLDKVIDYRGKPPPKTDKGVPLITARNVRMGYLDFKADEYIDENKYVEWMNRGFPVGGDVMFTTEAPLGNVAQYPSVGQYALGQRIITLQTKLDSCNNSFLFQSLLSPNMQKKINIRGTGSTAKGIKSKLFVKIPMSAPRIEEQEKIALFLGAVDKKIAGLQKKKDLLDTYKKGCMQKLFSQQIRFKDINGNPFPDWEERRIDDVYEVTRGHVLAVPKMTQTPKGDSIFPVYSSQTKNNGLTGYYPEYLYKNSITWTTDGANAGDVKYRSGKFYCTNVCGVLISNNGNANKCMSEILNTITHRYVSYVGNPKLMNNVMAKIKLYFPHPDEQKKIADFLSAIDEKIALAVAELDKAKSFKKGLLQQMFV